MNVDALMESLQSLPAILKVALPILIIFLVGAIARRLMKVVVIVALIILGIVFVYPLFDF